MDEQRLHYLHEGYLKGTLTELETLEWQGHLEDTGQELPIKELMGRTWEGIAPSERLVLDRERSDELFYGIVGRPAARRVPLWPRIGIAAAIVLLLVSVGILFFDSPFVGQELTVDVDPGKAGATLTLADGRKIRLSDVGSGELAKEAGVRIVKTADGQLVYEVLGNGVAGDNQFNTVSTARGETYQLRLPDGSMVWLNAASSLRYAANLVSDGKRRVELSGEGYFEVAKDAAHPFVVASSNQEVSVLGTHFNVNAYGDEPLVRTTLLEGSVRVSSGTRVQVLKPGFEALNRAGELKVQEAGDVEGVIDWKEGDFNLDRVDFRTAMRKIARWYDVEVVYGEDVPEDMVSTGIISRDRKLSAILEVIELSGQVKFRVEGRKIFVGR